MNGDLVRAVLVEHYGRALPVDVDELAVLAQHVEERTEVLVWQVVGSKLGGLGQHHPK
jgi:hypothetical protein